MNEQYDNLTSKENNNNFSTPRFRQSQLDKESNIKNTCSKLEISSFEDSKYESNKLDLKFPQDNNISNEKSDTLKSSKGGIIFKDNNFSLSSLINNDNSINIINNNSLINNKKEKEEKCDKALISFCDKSENYSFNNEIIYKEKDIASSAPTNKDIKEENDFEINSFIYKPEEEAAIKNKKIKEEKKVEINSKINSNKIIENTSMDNSNQNSHDSKRYSIFKNDSSSFKYNLPLANDKIPAIKDFFAFKENDITENENKIININKSLELDNTHLNSEKINKYNKKGINGELNDYKNNLFFKIVNNMAYSKKKVKRNNTERFCKTYKILSNEKQINNITIQTKNLLEKGLKNNNKYLNKITIKKNILHSCGNYSKIKKKIRKYDINNSKGANNEIKELSLSDKENCNKISPTKKLEIIIKNTEINLNNNNEVYNYNQIKSYNNKNYYNKFNENKNILDNINPFSSLTTRERKSNKFIKSTSFEFYDTLYNFKIKKMPGFERKNTDIISKESSNYNNKDIIKNPKNFGVYKKSNNKKIINKKYNNNNRSRNINNSYFNKMFNEKKISGNNIIFNTMNYRNNYLKNQTKQLKGKKYLHNQIKSKFKIESSSQLNNKIFRQNSKLINRMNNSEYTTPNNNNNTYNIYNTIYNSNNSSKKDKKKHNFNHKINNNSTYSKPYNLVLNYQNKKKSIEFENKNDIYNSIAFNRSNTDKNLKTNYELMIKDNSSYKNCKEYKDIKDFINIDESTNNSLQNISDSKFNKIKVNINMNTKNRHKKIKISQNTSYNMNKKNSYWKIYKKPKNSCLLNNFKIDPSNNDNLNSIPKKKNNNRGNSQFIAFKKNKLNNFIKDEDNSLSITNENLTERKNYFFINENLNIEQTKKELNSSKNLNVNKIYDNSSKLYKKNQNNSYRNKSSKIRELLNEDNINNINNNGKYEDIIKLSILRNNMNNQISKEFSVVVGDSNKKLIEVNNVDSKSKNNKDSNLLSNDNKRTIINVNQFYPSYFIRK